MLIYEIDEEQSKFIGEPTLLAYSLVDELLSKLFGFHVTEPKTAIKDQVKAKALFQKTVPIAGRFESEERESDRYSGLKKSNQLEPLVPKISE